MKTFFYATLSCALFFAFTCNAQKVHGTSGATKKNKGKKKEIVLPPAGDTYKVLGELNGLKNFAVQYDANFIRGGDILTGAAAAQLKKLNIKTVISISPTDFERKFCKDHGFKLVELEFTKDPGPSAKTLLSYIEALRINPAPYYVHCHGGAHRGGILGILYRVVKQDWKLEKATKEFVQLGGDPKKDEKSCTTFLTK